MKIPYFPPQSGNAYDLTQGANFTVWSAVGSN